MQATPTPHDHPTQRYRQQRELVTMCASRVDSGTDGPAAVAAIPIGHSEKCREVSLLLMSVSLFCASVL
jgi:hypothetical protein